MSTIIDTTIFYNSGVTAQSINLILYAANLQAWNTGTVSLDTLTAGNWSEHLIPMAESSALGFYYVDLTMIAPLPANTLFSGYLYQGSMPSAPIAAVGIFRWTGTQIVQLETSLTNLALPAVAAGAAGGLPLGDAAGHVQLIAAESAQLAAIGTPPTAAAILTAFKTDADFAVLLGESRGFYTFTPPVAFPGTGVLVLKDYTNTVTLATFTISYDASKNTITRTVV